MKTNISLQDILNITYADDAYMSLNGGKYIIRFQVKNSSLDAVKNKKVFSQYEYNKNCPRVSHIAECVVECGNSPDTPLQGEFLINHDIDLKRFSSSLNIKDSEKFSHSVSVTDIDVIMYRYTDDDISENYYYTTPKSVSDFSNSRSSRNELLRDILISFKNNFCSKSSDFVVDGESIDSICGYRLTFTAKDNVPMEYFLNAKNYINDMFELVFSHLSFDIETAVSFENRQVEITISWKI